MQDKSYSLTEVANLYRVSLRTVFNWLNSSKIPTEQIVKNPRSGPNSGKRIKKKWIDGRLELEKLGKLEKYP